MANYVVFLDQEHAKILELHPAGVTEKKMKKHNTEEEKFFHEVSGQLKEAHEILLLGPGLAKEHFKAHLIKHHHEQVAKKIVGVETVDHPTDGQMVALAKKFFKAHLAFE